MSLHIDAPRSRAQEVADRLGEVIARMDPGDRLGTKDELRIRAGVAVATMNEAIRLLQARKAITLRTGPNGGVFVATPDPLVRISDALAAVQGRPETVMDAVALRAALDPLTVIEASRHRSASDLRRLRALVDRMSAALDDDLQFARANWAFHEAVIAIGKNEILKNVALGLIEIISANVVDIVPGSKTDEQKRERVRVHAALIEAIESGDPDQCNRASIAHSIDAGGVHRAG